MKKVPGTTDALHEKWKKRCKDFVSNGYPHRHTFKKLCRQMIQEFDQIETLDVKKPRVGIVGEILVKFLPAANNHLVELLEKRRRRSSRSGSSGLFTLLLLQPEFQGIPPWHEKIQGCTRKSWYSCA